MALQFLGPFLNDLTLDSASAKLFGDTPGLSHTFQIHFTVVTDLFKKAFIFRYALEVCISENNFLAFKGECLQSVA